MTGLVLCGGQSSRMGKDKGLLEHEAKTWARLASAKLSSLNIPILFSVNNNQLPVYSEIFPADKLVTDKNELQIKGPLLGVLSAHLHIPDEDLFVLACDMPLMETNTLKQLNEVYSTNRNPDAFIFTNDGEPEPLCGIYKATALQTILSLYKSNQLLKHSMKFMLKQVNTFTIPLKEEQKKFFQNFNAQAELNGLIK